MKFKLESEFKPTGDQPTAIASLVEGLNNHIPAQTLQGVTGSGKTFTMANVIANINRPTLILSHNKTLAAQLYGEFKAFFPHNAVEYFVSYYDYYQPEAFLPTTNTYIEKDLSINTDIEKLRMEATTALLSGRKDVVIISSVSCLYGMGSPEDFEASTITIKQGQKIGRDTFLRTLVDSLYSRNEISPGPGNFRVKGDTVDIFLAYGNLNLRVTFWGDDIDSIESIDKENNIRIEQFEEYIIYPATLFITTKERMFRAITEIELDMGKQVEFFQSIGKPYEAKRLYERVSYDLEMLREVGYCSGIENYSRYFDNRKPGTRPFCLLDFFPKDFLMIVDESHVTIPQIRAMYGGDHSRKENLVEFGFRLPAALDNRPLKFEEFESLLNQVIFVSATPADYELMQSEGIVVEQLIRPTGLIDPPIEIRPSMNQVDDLMEEIQQRIEVDERILVVTLTKRMAEELSSYLTNNGINTAYIHSDVDTLERVEIMEALREGKYDVLVGVNLLREGLDLPEVSLVAILDADKEGFLRSERALTQTAGRAARNVNGKVIFYADNMTDSMQRTISESSRRREIQMAYNEEHGIIPKQIKKSREATFSFRKEEDIAPKPYIQNKRLSKAAEKDVGYMNREEIIRAIDNAKKQMGIAAKKLEFLEAAQFRDQIIQLEETLKQIDK